MLEIAHEQFCEFQGRRIRAVSSITVAQKGLSTRRER